MPIDYRHHPVHGWDHSKLVPKVKDLVVIATNRTGEKGRVMRLVEDLPDRQTIEVCDSLASEFGTRIRLNRRGDIRPMSELDKVAVVSTDYKGDLKGKHPLTKENEQIIDSVLKDTDYRTGQMSMDDLALILNAARDEGKAMNATEWSVSTSEGQLIALCCMGDDAVAQYKKCLSAAFDDDAVGGIYGFNRKDLTPVLERLDVPSAGEFSLLDGLADQSEMIIIDSGNKYGDEWKYLFHTKTKVGIFIKESEQQH